MKLTKYAQSCVLIETEGKKILIDLGYLVAEYGTSLEDFKDIDLLLLTHRHPDHADPASIKIVKKNNPDMKIYTNSEVAEILKEKGIDSELVKVGDVITIDNVEVDAVEAVHGYLYPMGDKGYPKDNNGYVVKGEGKTVYHCSDTITFNCKVSEPDVIFIPVCGHGVVMEAEAAVETCKNGIKPKLTIPMHYHSDNHPKGSEKFEAAAKKEGLKYKILKIGESIEI